MVDGRRRVGRKGILLDFVSACLCCIFLEWVNGHFLDWQWKKEDGKVKIFWDLDRSLFDRG